MHTFALHAQASKDRYMRNVRLLDIVDRSFRSYNDVAVSIMNQLLVGPIFEALRLGHVIPSVGDHPKQLLERKLLMQIHLAALLKQVSV
jgi:hypothetical protein